MEYGVTFASEIDSWKWAKRAEELGFSSAWFYDTQLLNPDVFICMALAAANTSKIRLGTGVLVPSNRIEPVTANAFASLNKIAPGRIDFGVGTGFTARRTMGLGAIPLAKTRTYVERVQKLLRGEIIDWDFEGEDRKIGFLDPELGLINLEDDVPVWVSAFGPKGQQMTADLKAGWLNFSSSLSSVDDIERMKTTWTAAGNQPDSLRSVLFFVGAVLTGDKETDDRLLMEQGGPATSVIFHNFADEMGAMGGATLQGPLKDLLDTYLKVHGTYQPTDAKYLQNHKGHLMYVRPDETHITPDLVRATTMSGRREELVEKLRAIKAAGYTQVSIQLMHGHEQALEAWADVFDAV